MLLMKTKTETKNSTGQMKGATTFIYSSLLWPTAFLVKSKERNTFNLDSEYEILFDQNSQGLYPFLLWATVLFWRNKNRFHKSTRPSFLESPKKV